jgi:hypothetical protein
MKTVRAAPIQYLRTTTITTLIAFIARSPAPRRPNARAHPHLLLLRLIATLGGSIAAVCSRHRLPLDCDFATHRGFY